jgi:hypothetical protein
METSEIEVLEVLKGQELHFFGRGTNPMSRNENRRRWRNVLVHHSFQLRLALIHTMFVVFLVVVLVSITVGATIL